MVAEPVPPALLQLFLCKNTHNFLTSNEYNLPLDFIVQCLSQKYTKMVQIPALHTLLRSRFRA